MKRYKVQRMEENGEVQFRLLFFYTRRSGKYIVGEYISTSNNTFTSKHAAVKYAKKLR